MLSTQQYQAHENNYRNNDLAYDLGEVEFNTQNAYKSTRLSHKISWA